MYIQCPACKAKAQIPDSKEGAKVRCGECSRVYVAAPVGQRGSRTKSSQNSGLYIGLGVGAAVLLLFLILSNKSGDDGPAPVVEAEEPVKVEKTYTDDVGWDSPAVKLVRRIHELAAVQDEGTIMACLEPSHIHAMNLQREAEEAALDAGETEPVLPDFSENVLAFGNLSLADQVNVTKGAIQDLLKGESKDLVANWRPYEGKVADLTDDYAVVQVDAVPLAGGTEKRTIEWELVRDGKQWKAFRWERWYSDAEKRAKRKKRGRGYEKVTLSDGSKVFEREPEPLPHLEDTPAELRAEIDRLFDELVGDEPKVFQKARTRLTEIGKPAIPRLLTGLFELPLGTGGTEVELDQAIIVNGVVTTLRDITGQHFGFKPMTLVGSAVGTSEERRQSAIKQWFAWWYRKGERFEKKVTTDALEDLIELTDQEKAWLERNKD